MINKTQFIKNNLLVFSNKIISKIITFGIMVVLTRQLSSNDFGNLTILITMSSVFGALLDLGSNFVVVREIAVNHSRAKKILINTLFLKTISGLFCYLGMISFVYLMGYSIIIIRLSYIFAFGMLAESFLLTLVKQFEGKEEMKYSSTIIIIERIFIALFIVLFSLKISVLFSYGIAYIFSNGIVFVIGLIFTLKTLNIRIYFDLKLAKSIFIASGVFMIFIIFSTIYSRIDIFLIYKFLNEVQVATYRACYQIIESIYFIPMNISVSLLPFFSKQLKDDPEKLRKIYSQISRQLLILSIFISITVFCGSRLILTTLYNKYLDGSSLFSLLALSIPFYFANSINGNLLIALSKEKSVTIALIVSSLVKMVLLIFLVKILGLEGAAISTVIAEIISFAFQYSAIYKYGFNVRINIEDVTNIIIIIIYGLIIYFVQNIFFLLIFSLSVGIWSSKNILFFVRENLFARRA